MEAAPALAAADAAVVGEVGAAAVGVPGWVVAAATQASPVQAVATVALVANLVPVDSAKAKAAIQGGAVALAGLFGGGGGSGGVGGGGGLG